MEQRKLPEGKDNKERLVKLQHCIVDTLEWAFNEDRPITDKRYNKLIGLVVASFYCYAPQGRVQGISDIPYGIKAAPGQLGCPGAAFAEQILDESKRLFLIFILSPFLY